MWHAFTKPYQWQKYSKTSTTENPCVHLCLFVSEHHACDNQHDILIQRNGCWGYRQRQVKHNFFFHFHTVLSHMFTTAQATKTILSRVVTSSPSRTNSFSVGIISFRIVNFPDSTPITLSTWIHRCASLLVLSTSQADN